MTGPRLAERMADALPRLLPAFLPQRRWFGGKARPIAGVDVEDAAWLPGDRGRALVVTRVRDTSGATTRYALLLAFGGDAADLPEIGRLAGDGEEGEEIVMAEAGTDPDAIGGLLRGFASAGDADLPMLHGGTLQYRDADAQTARVIAGGPAVRPIGAEQSNTSLRVGRSFAFKLFRRLESGENPELEIGRFLTARTPFRDMPVLRGSLTYVPARGEPATLGVLQDWIESQGDGWNHVIALLRQTDDAAAALQESASSLGATTASFHRALASGTGDEAFAPEPVTRADADAWRQGLAARLSRTADLVAGHLPGWPEPSRRLGASFVDGVAGTDLLGALPDPELPGARFDKIRVHGDYHLGQTLKTAGGFALIDFEGEPARPLAERRAKQAALKDVAGMIRSFDYAAEAARAGGAHPDDRPAGHLLRGAFLDGYRQACAGGAAFLPADSRAVKAWIDAFEMEKALYEVEYEVNNRPAWVHIPLRGLVRILSGRIQKEAR